MINALMLTAGATVFFIGFYLGLHFDFPKSDSAKKGAEKRSAGVIKNKEYVNFLNYDGTELK